MPAIAPALPAPYLTSNTRRAGDLLIEISGHLVEDCVNTALTLPVDPGAPGSPSYLTPQLFTPLSMLAIYPGAMIVLALPDGTQPQVITVATVDIVAGTFTALVTQPYPTGSTLLAGTFPTQATTDPLFTQTEILSYLARAQNDFLTKIPLIYKFSSQNVNLGEEFQSVPPDAIEMERVSIYGSRLYQTTQQQVALRDPQWYYDTTAPLPEAWFEDRTGYYGWGLAPPPQVSLEARLIYSQRGPDELGLLDLFLVPDVMLHAVRWLAMVYIWTKAGENRSPSMARIAAQRYATIIAIAQRFLTGDQESPGSR